MIFGKISNLTLRFLAQTENSAQTFSYQISLLKLLFDETSNYLSQYFTWKALKYKLIKFFKTTKLWRYSKCTGKPFRLVQAEENHCVSCSLKGKSGIDLNEVYGPSLAIKTLRHAEKSPVKQSWFQPILPKLSQLRFRVKENSKDGWSFVSFFFEDKWTFFASRCHQISICFSITCIYLRIVTGELNFKFCCGFSQQNVKLTYLFRK